MLVYNPEEERPIPTQIGGKAYSLAQMQNMNINIPKWIAVTADCFLDFLYESHDEYFRLINDFNEENRQKIVKIIEATHFSESTKQLIRNEMAKTFSPMALVSVRSSAIDEDTTSHVFAGLLDTFLYQKQDDDIFECIKKCYISCFSSRAMEYRAKHKMITPHIRMAVIIQEMISPDYAGIIYTSHPQTHNPDETLISVVTGTGENMISGKENSSDYTVNAAREVSNENPQRKARLDDNTILSLYDTAQQIEAGFSPRIARCIEFALKGQDIYILQSRPMVEFAHLDKLKPRTILDNSKLSEDYYGATTPLTYSFAREIYRNAYQKTLHDFHISDENIDNIQDSLDHLIYIFDNRIYCNENHFQKITSLLPSRAREGNTKITPHLAHKFFKIKTMNHRFILKTARAIRPYRNISFENYTNEQLLDVYKDLENDILNYYSTPIINNIATVATYNSLLEIAKKQNIFNYQGVVNEVISKLGNIEAANRNEELIKLAKEIRHDPTLYKLFKDTDTEQLVYELEDNKLIIFSKIKSFIEKYSADAPDELKFESLTIRQNPALLIDIIKQYLNYPQALNSHKHHDRTIEQKFINQFKGQDRPRVKYLLQKTKTLIANREALHFRRAQVFAVVRSIYLRIGQNLTNERLIRNPTDVFYLTKDEITDIIKHGKYTIDTIRNRIEDRHNTYLASSKHDSPHRLCFYGDIHAKNMISVLDHQEISAKNTTRPLKGAACGGKTVTGKVKYIEDIRQTDLNGAILMTKHADSAWTAIFPIADAIIVEEGSALSHYATIAREFDTPIIAGIRGLTAKVHDGDTVKIDGKRGTVEIIK